MDIPGRTKLGARLGASVLAVTLGLTIGICAQPARAAAFSPVRPSSDVRLGKVIEAHHQIGSFGTIAGSEKPSWTEDTIPDDQVEVHARRVAAIDSYLRHIYTIYLGLKACSELRSQQNDPSFLPTVGVEEARKALHAIDTSASDVGIDVGARWAEAVPKAVVTAEALKRVPQQVVAICQRMGGIFRTDEANLQHMLGMLGSKQVLIPKDF